MFECVSDTTLQVLTQNVAIAIVGWSFFRYVFGTKR